MGQSTSNKIKGPKPPKRSKNCKQCTTSVQYGHCCYNECFVSIFNSHSFVDVTEIKWHFSKKHEIELYNVLLQNKLESIVPIIVVYLPLRKDIINDQNQLNSNQNNVNKSLISTDPQRDRAQSVPYYVPDVNASSSNPSSVHAYFHGYISLYNRNQPPCKIWMKTLSFSKNITTNDQLPLKKLQITILGDVGVGKSALAYRYLQNEFYDNYDPTIEDYFTNILSLTANSDDDGDHNTMKYDFNVNKMEQEILDTAGGDVIGMAGNIDKWIENGQILLLCFDVSRGLTLIYLTSYIIPRIQSHFELKHKSASKLYTMNKSNHIGPCGVILVGCKVDLRNSLRKDNFSTTYYEHIAEEISKNYDSAMTVACKYNIPYIETSAKNGKNVPFLFEQCVHEYWIQTQSNCINWDT